MGMVLLYIWKLLGERILKVLITKKKKFVTICVRWWMLNKSIVVIVSQYIQTSNHRIGTSLVAQWLRIRLPMQGTRVRSLVREDPTCCGATKPVCHNYWACVLQLLKPVCLEPVLRNKRSHRNEKPAHRNKE